jgi:type II secretion system protein N
MAWLGYGLFALLIAAGSLYWLFPATEVLGYMNSSMKNNQPDFSFAAAELKPWLPLRLRAKNFMVAKAPIESPVFKADTLVAGQRIFDFLRGRSVYEVEGSAYNGEFSGWLRTRPGTGRILEAEFGVHEIDLAAFEYLSVLFGRHLNGILAGSVLLKSEKTLLDGTGKMLLSVTDGRVEFLQPLFGLHEVPFKEVTFEGDLAGGRVHMNVRLQGPDWRGELSGAVRLAADIRQSRLDLQGTIEPLSHFYQNYPQAAEALKLLKKKMKNGRYPFAVSGTVEKPIFQLI